MPLGHHVTLRLSDDRVIAPDPADRRRLARVIAGAARPFRLLAFAAADNHIHLETAEPRDLSLELARRVAIGLRQTLRIDVPFEPARARPIVDQRHGYAAFHYLFRQERHHRTQLDPHFDGSSLPDLLGMRQIGLACRRDVAKLLPRVTREQLLDHLGVPHLDHAPMDLTDLADAAAAAFGLVSLSDRSATTRRARLAAVAVAETHVPFERLAPLLGMDPRSLRRIRARAANDPARAPTSADVQAVLLQARLRGARAMRAAENSRNRTELAATVRRDGFGPGGELVSS